MEAVMDAHSRPRVAIVGAGAAGVLLANALTRPGSVSDVVLADPKPARGPAFGDGEETLLLNTRAGDVSLDEESPGGFVDWLNTYRNRPRRWTGEDFAPRRLYGDYLA